MVGQLQGTEIFMIGDNSIEEATCYKGLSTNKLLHNLGANSISCGRFEEGVMRGEDLLLFVLLNKSATQVHPSGYDIVGYSKVKIGV
eukprot:11505324-Ditylum_brightwellii.AAC.1